MVHLVEVEYQRSTDATLRQNYKDLGTVYPAPCQLCRGLVQTCCGGGLIEFVKDEDRLAFIRTLKVIQ